MSLGELIELLQKASVQNNVTRDTPVIMRVNNCGVVNHHFVDHVVIWHDMDTDSVLVILEKEITK